MKRVIWCALLTIACGVAQASLIDQPSASLPARTKTFVYKTIGQTRLDMAVYYPVGWKKTDKRPAIVFFFGGGWNSGTIAEFKGQADYLAGRGMVAACADYRVKSRQGVTPKECVEDAKSAVRWLRKNAAMLGIDPKRVAASGGSAGGHLAASTALTPGLDEPGEDLSISSQPDALVLFNPVLDLTAPKRAGLVGNNQALANALSPTFHLRKDSPPTILFYGTADELLSQGEAFMERSKALGHHAELYTAEGQKHGFFNWEPWRERTMQRMDEFLTSIGYLAKMTVTQTQKEAE